MKPHSGAHWISLLLALVAPITCSSPRSSQDALPQNTADVPPDEFRSGAVLLVRKVTFGEPEGLGAICRYRQERGIARLPDGGIAVQGCDCAKVSIFDATGTYESTLGPSCGEGPGELTDFISVAVGQGAQVVISGIPGRLLTFDRSDGRLLHEISVPYNAVVVGVLPDGRRLLKYLRRESNEDFTGLHIHNAQGERERSFYSVEPTGDQRVWYSHVSTFRTAIDGRGHIWTVRSENRYEVKEWDSSGNLVRKLSESPAWFRSYPEPFTAARPRVETIAWHDGLLWVIAITPLEWRADPTMPAETGFATAADALAAYKAVAPDREWVVAAIDPAHGTIVAEGRFHPAVDNLRMLVGTEGGFYRNEFNSTGDVRVSLFEPRLTIPTSRVPE